MQFLALFVMYVGGNWSTQKKSTLSKSVVCTLYHMRNRSNFEPRTSEVTGANLSTVPLCQPNYWFHLLSSPQCISASAAWFYELIRGVPQAHCPAVSWFYQGSSPQCQQHVGSTRGVCFSVSSLLFLPGMSAGEFPSVMSVSAVCWFYHESSPYCQQHVGSTRGVRFSVSSLLVLPGMSAGEFPSVSVGCTNACQGSSPQCSTSTSTPAALVWVETDSNYIHHIHVLDSITTE
jgi:hypothetical protein